MSRATHLVGTAGLLQ